MGAIVGMFVGAVLTAAVLGPTLYHTDKEIQALVLENKTLVLDVERAEAETHVVCSYLSVDVLDSHDLTECQ